MSNERRRQDFDLSKLTTVPFDHHSLAFWGTAGFMLIEGFTLLLMAASYFYLRLNELEWPPGRTPAPDLLIPTINVIVLALGIVPLRIADRAARVFDKRTVIIGLLIGTAMSFSSAILRWFELKALNVAWDAHGYASVAWGLLVLHGTLIVTDVFETGTFAALFMTGRAMKKHYPDVSDACFYQYHLPHCVLGAACLLTCFSASPAFTAACGTRCWVLHCHGHWVSRSSTAWCPLRVAPIASWPSTSSAPSRWCSHCFPDWSRGVCGSWPATTSPMKARRRSDAHALWA
jgi:cytochrome c oxidase subunit III